MSSLETLNFLRKSLGIIIKRLEETGVLAYTVGKDHTFIPEVSVDDAGVELPVEGFLYSIRVHPDSAPVKFNIDRPVSDTEWSAVFPGTIKKVSRIASRLYLKAPLGQKSLVDVEVLRL